METQLTSVKEDLSKVTSERDSMRNSLLEAEIANHENNNDRSRESENLKLELVKSQSAIETLEVTLSVRDNELKSKKEEIRKEKVRTMYLHMRKILMIDAQTEYEPLTNFFRAPALTLSLKKLGYLP